MWAVKPPRVTAEEAARACAQSIGDKTVKQALLDALPHLVVSSSRYQNAGVTDLLHEISPETYRVPGISDLQMRAIYASNLVRATSPGRRIYEILAQGLCSYCRYSVARTLDHFVPKSVAGGLSIEPWNLVPCCGACNHIMSDDWSSDPAEQLLHPYFVEELGRWLYATVTHQDPPTAVFVAVPASTLDAGMADRIRRQFDLLDLARTYGEASSPDLAVVDAQLTSLALDSSSEISAFLAEMAAVELAVQGNARRGALYEALSIDQWFTSRYVACK